MCGTWPAANQLIFVNLCHPCTADPTANFQHSEFSEVGE
jgi:hypothetical protein